MLKKNKRWINQNCKKNDIRAPGCGCQCTGVYQHDTLCSRHAESKSLTRASAVPRRTPPWPRALLHCRGQSAPKVLITDIKLQLDSQAGKALAAGQFNSRWMPGFLNWRKISPSQGPELPERSSSFSNSIAFTLTLHKKLYRLSSYV